MSSHFALAAATTKSAPAKPPKSSPTKSSPAKGVGTEAPATAANAPTPAVPATTPAVPAINNAVTARHVKSERVPLDDLSTCEESSWRDVDLEQVDQYEKDIEAGNHGSTAMGNAQVLCDSAGHANFMGTPS